jgi:hypothetical protein
LDSNLNVQVADNSANTSGGIQPTWNTNLYGPTLDGTVHWRNQGPLSGPTPPTWQANFGYPGAFEIVDPVNNIQIASLGGGTSGGTIPAFGPNEGDTVSDGTIVWTNLGANPVSGLSASGGTSGIIMDNTVNPTVSAKGTSQVYFSNLQDFGCDLGTGGCAIQASQQGLN